MKLLYYPLYPIILLVGFLAGILPPRLAHAGAWVIGSVAYFLMPGRRKTMGLNYAPVLGKSPRHPQVRRVGRLAMRGFTRYAYDLLAFHHRSAADIEKRVTLHVGDDVYAALRSGKGMIFVSAHFGNMDYAASVVSRCMVPMTVVADPLRPRQLMEHLVRLRGKGGVHIVYGAKAPRAVLEALRRNEGVGFLLDVGCNRKGTVPVRFFGRRTMFPAGPALLSLRTGAPIVVGYALVQGDHVHAYSYPPIYATSTGDKEADVQRCSQAIADCFADFIARYPEQWYIFRPMWVNEAPGEVSHLPTADRPVREPVAETL